MANPAAAIPIPMAYYLSALEKQSKRIAELARFMPFAEQEQEMERLARELKQVAALFRDLFQSQ
jgi:ABC-type tungstate transport system substrate-binding protein